MAGPKHPRVQYRCSFCGKSQDQVHGLIAGPGGVYICDECIELCREIIAEELSASAAKRPQIPKVPNTSAGHGTAESAGSSGGRGI
ncbi:MAG: ClpX C4-type zinc finger protein [Chloroflexota bacterium]|nr:MAG: hypothetical protein DLM70_06650 [Chloroflexota bacterium]